MNEKFESCVQSLARIEEDEQVRLFFSVLANGSDIIDDVVSNVLSLRPNITVEHLAYLLFACLQYLTKYQYDSIKAKEAQQRVNNDLIRYRNRVIGLCVRNNLSTHVVDRYVLLQLIVNALRRRLTVVELGCSIGLGLMSLNSGIFKNKPMADPRLRSLLQASVDISQAIGIDTAVGDLSSLSWIKACILPANEIERGRLDELARLLAKTGTRISTVQIDMLRIPELGAKYRECADVIWISSTLYQIGHTYKESLEMLRPIVQYLLAKESILAIADYKNWDSVFGGAGNSYQVLIYPSADLGNPLAVLESPNDSVAEVAPGKDFESFLNLFCCRDNL